jgi:phage terminase large subunit GpA-like protein
MKPSDWYEANMVMPQGSAFAGPYRYRRSPYLREIIDCFSKEHPMHTIAVMKGAQIGVSAGVLMAIIGFIISQDPSNILFMTGHGDLSKEAMVKIDQMIDACGIRHLIRPSTLRAKNSRTGDTDSTKEFAGGTLWSGSATNHNLLRQRDVRVIIVDDADAAKKSGKDTGSTMALIEQRAAAYATKRKVSYISTPQIKGQSIIEDAYLLGDQRKYNVECPCCGERIPLEWETKLIGSETEKAGITWQLDESNRVIPESVGYTCQSCGGFFDDSCKQELLEGGIWIPTATPSTEGYYSYHISALYAPVGMYDWKHYINEYLKANPVGGERDTRKHQTFMNVVLGLTYEDEAIELKASDLQRNQREYTPYIIPESLSIKDGNGKIITLTLGADLNGKEDDARLDWEIVAWSETGATYSVAHGSIGTFVPRERGQGADRQRWTYRRGTQWSVWPEFDKVFDTVFSTDTGRKMQAIIGGVDAGYQSEHVYPYIDNHNRLMYALKGDVSNGFTPYQRDAKTFKPARERAKMFILEPNLLKDELAKYMGLRWNQGDNQPAWFMNFPRSENGLYQYSNYFSHFEAEKRVTQTTATGEPKGTKWEKKDSNVQNHLFDCRLYNMAIKDILLDKVGKELKAKDFTWSDYADVVLGRVK